MYNAVDRVPSRARLSWKKPNPLIVAWALTCSWIAWLYHFNARYYRPQVSTKALDVALMLAMLLVAPLCPGTIEHFTRDALVRVNHAPIPNEGTNWTGEVGQLLY